MFQTRFVLLVTSLLSISAFAGPGKDRMENLVFGNQEGIHSDALLVMKDGKTLYERYARGYTTDSKHLSWSMAKSITGFIAAQAEAEGRLSLTDRLDHWMPTYSGEAKLIDLIHMSSGIAFREEYSGIPVDSDATRMFYLDGPTVGMANYTASRPKRPGVSPGDHFYYSSGDTNLVSEALHNALPSQAEYDAYPWDAFFSRIGIKDATFEQDTQGTFSGASYVYLAARDYARIGQLLANGGTWEGKQVIPESYWKLMNTVAPGVQNPIAGTSPTRAYSMFITTNLPITGRGLPSEYPDLPRDSLLMIGHQGQLVIASPRENLVIVRLATDKGDIFADHRQEFFSAVDAFVKESGFTTRTVRDETPSGGKIGTNIQSAAGEKPPVLDYLKVPRLIRALYAKELCTCLFVEKRTRTLCDEDLKITLPVLAHAKIDEAKQTVHASLLGSKHSTAIYRGDRLGCTLQK